MGESINIADDCPICGGGGRIEIPVMGTDMEWVECPMCTLKPEYKEFQTWMGE